MGFLDEILSKINEDSTNNDAENKGREYPEGEKAKESGPQKEQSLLQYSEAFYEAFKR